ncbi:phosphotransferase [Terrabacter lapilli]
MTIDIAQVTSRLAATPAGAVTLTPIAYEWGSPATAGLWRAVAARPDGSDATYFVKLLRHPRLWPGLVQVPEGELRDFFLNSFPWRFELDMAVSGIADVLPPGMRTPTLHHHEELDDDHVGLWWEFVHERPGRWSLDELARAARLLGRLAARRRAGAEVNERLPDICRLPAGAALRYLVEGRVLHGAGADLADDELWAQPVLVEALRATGDLHLRDDLRAHFSLVLDVLTELDRLPQTYAHGDASIQNILVCEGKEDFVVIDWGFASPLAVGFDLGQLLVGPMHAGSCLPPTSRSSTPSSSRATFRGSPTRTTPSTPMTSASATSGPSSPARPSPRSRRSSCATALLSPCTGPSSSASP